MKVPHKLRRVRRKELVKVSCSGKRLAGKAQVGVNIQLAAFVLTVEGIILLRRWETASTSPLLIKNSPQA